jgi:hypothetical protein
MEVDGVPFVLTADLPDGGDHVAVRRRGRTVIVTGDDVSGLRMRELASRYADAPVLAPQWGASSAAGTGH